jgi:uncharacterized membrane protein
MKVLFKLLDQIEETLGHSPHPAIVAVPLGGWTVSAICDALGLATGRPAYDDAARLSMGIGLVGAAGAILTGLHDYSYIPRDRPTHDIATSHATCMAIATTLFGASFVLRERPHQTGSGPGWTARALALSGLGAALYGAYLGGVLVEEYGEAVKPVIRQQKKEKEELDREKAREQVAAGPARESRERTPVPVGQT